MTNEERIEERLIHAHERGYYEKVMERVIRHMSENPKADQYKVYDKICEDCKLEWLNETNGTTEHTPN